MLWISEVLASKVSLSPNCFISRLDMFAIWFNWASLLLKLQSSIKSVCLLLNMRILPVTTRVMENISTNKTLKTMLREKPENELIDMGYLKGLFFLLAEEGEQEAENKHGHKYERRFLQVGVGHARCRILGGIA